MTSLDPDNNRTLIDELLAEQQSLTAVDRFAQRNGHHAAPSSENFYRDLIPLTQPQPGQQYAFEVDLDKCSGCKACVSACHSLNGLDDDETWRDVGLLFSDDWRKPFQQTVTTACHHCVDPGCLNGCPVLAYDKDPFTGIVRHLDDQCIGCQYCVMKCPYDVPKYSKKRGIVRKCDMCANRLAIGEAPACVQACPSEAIRIITVNKAEIAAAASRENFLPSAPDSSLTLPTTLYKSSKPLPLSLVAGDHAQLKPSDSHLPLVFMLALTQLSVGASVAAVFAEPAKWLTFIAASMSVLALCIAALHLGKPLKAWRSFLGWRKSWFSREVIVFSAFSPLAAAAALNAQQDDSFLLLRIAAAVAGLMGVACSAMIYADTHREFWRASQCFGKFFGTVLLLGAATTLAVQAFTRSEVISLIPAIVLLFAATLAKLGFEHRIFRYLVDENTPALSPLHKTARLIADKLGLAARWRVACGIFGGIVLPVCLIANRSGNNAAVASVAIAALMFCIAGELLERYLFFTAVAPAKMPGGVAV